VAADGKRPATRWTRQHPHHTEEGSTAMSDPSNTRNGVKTLGIKLPAELHAQFVLVAQLDGLNLNDAALRAVEFYVESKRSEGDFAARAADALAEIEREAATRRAAIEGLFGSASPSTPADKPARSRKTDTES
jgi:hypothetical protein